MKNISDFKDAQGFIGHKWIGGSQTLEFGDGSQRFGMNDLMEWSTCEWAEKKREIEAQFRFRHSLITAGQEPVRHPAPEGAWWADIETMSRDGWAPQVAMFHAINDEKRLDEMAKQLKERLFFLWNLRDIWSKERKVIPIPDWSSLNLIGLLYRLRAPRIVRELADSWLILESLARVLSSWFAPNHTSADLTFFTMMKSRELNKPTITFWIAMWIYFELHFKGPEWAFVQYFSDEKAPPLDIVLIKAANQTRSRLWSFRNSLNGRS